MRVALAQINTTVGDVWGNTERAAEAFKRAAEAGAELVALPELTITGYPPEDLLLRPSFIKDNLKALEELAAEVPHGVVGAVGFVDLDSDLYNACAVISSGEIVHRYHKRYLPNYGVFDENRYFREGTGAPVVGLDGALVGVSVCEDIWYPGDQPGSRLWVGRACSSTSPPHPTTAARAPTGRGCSGSGPRTTAATCYAAFAILCNAQQPLTAHS